MAYTALQMFHFVQGEQGFKFDVTPSSEEGSCTHHIVSWSVAVVVDGKIGLVVKPLNDPDFKQIVSPDLRYLAMLRDANGLVSVDRFDEVLPILREYGRSVICARSKDALGEFEVTRPDITIYRPEDASTA